MFLLFSLWTHSHFYWDSPCRRTASTRSLAARAGGRGARRRDFNAADLRSMVGSAAGRSLARMPARGNAAMTAGYMGSSEIFDDAMCEFAVEYADLAQRDHRAFVKAVRQGCIKAVMDA
jgi:hypothetical protein